MYSKLKQTVHENALKAYNTGLMAGTSGNFSTVDRDLKVMAITPSGAAYETMLPEDITVIDFNGNILSGTKPPSSEWQMHLSIYEKISDVGGVAHTHSPYATSFAVLNQSIPVVLIEMVLLGGKVPLAPFAMPGSKELGDVTAETLLKEQTSACLLANHGALTIGKTMDEAYMKAVYLEDSAKIYHFARSIGDVRLVKESAIKKMKEKLGL
ncbi:class II aldolase/adducin family protein [Lysinibacillus sp. NPDC096418]|uniref:class II aldolase/adducin family protein n=1 Tax=Lysinibacillus sp. NPDC096418 TaxID=3364138 RepID=UPI00381ADA96